MEFRFTPEQEAFRREVQEFLRRELLPDSMGPVTLGDEADREMSMAMKRKLAAKGWLAVSWPRGYGGMGASLIQQVILQEELSSHWAPGLDPIGVKRLGPTLMRWGTEEQKRRFLLPIARGEVQWCQGYSEPGVGSDLASVQTQAVWGGDGYTVTGSKVWTSLAHWADWMFLLARMDPGAPKHRGLSFLLLEMGSPGITIRPILNMAGVHSFNQVFLDSVWVPRENLVREENRGWYVAVTLLDFERSGVEYPAQCRRVVEDLARYVRETGGGDLRVRARLAERYIETEVGRLLAYRVAWLQERGEVPNQEASIGKLFGTELVCRVAETGMQVLGLSGQLDRGTSWAPLRGAVAQMGLCSPSPAIGAGTSEVQRGIIATRGLGLPRG